MVNNNDIPRGPEDIPLKSIIKTLPIVIIIKDIQSNRKIREEHVDFSSIDIRKWIGKITAYCVLNGYSVTTCAEADYVIEE